MAFPTFDLDLAPPGKMTMPAHTGGGVEGGRVQSGGVRAIDFSGGGLVTVSYKSIQLGNATPNGLRYWSRLGAMLNSRVRSILVPLMTEFWSPQEWTVTFAEPAALNAGTVVLDVSGLFLLEDTFVGGEWFEVEYGGALASRSYCITDIDSVVPTGERTYRITCGIRSPLRAAVGAGAIANFVRPKVLMSLAPGSQITAEIERNFWTTPDVSFLESFGTT